MTIRLTGLGLDVTTGQRLFQPLSEQEFGLQVLRGLQRNADRFDAVREAHSTAVAFRGEIERRPTVDLGDPRQAGWSYLLSTSDRRAAEWKEALLPLAEHRGMPNPERPLLFDGRDGGSWPDWILDVFGPFQKHRPHYLLIIGGPDQVPFRLQSFLDSTAAVGRLDFGTPEELRAYVEKVLRLESADDPVVSRRGLVFATDHGWPDPTWLSRRYLAKPIEERMRDHHGLEVEALVAHKASGEALGECTGGVSPAVVFTAGHGQFVSVEDEVLRRRLNGAVVCQPGAGAQLLTAEDIARHESFAEGAVFFQFACFGYGTPAESGFSHWFEDIGATLPVRNAEHDFVAALPRRLLAHPRGPLAYVGHLDVACLHGFDDPEDPLAVEMAGQRWHARLGPFVDAIDGLLAVQPVGLALAAMNKRFDLANAALSQYYDRSRADAAAAESPELLSQLAHTFILRTDAQNYMVFGDPAVRLRIPT